MDSPDSSENKCYHNLFLLLSILSGTIGAVSNGMHVGYSAPLFHPFEGETSVFDRNVTLQQSHQNSINEQMLIKTFYFFGALIGIPISVFCNNISFKIVTTINSTVSLISWILIASTTSWTGLNTARTLAGISTTLMLITVPKYLKEIAAIKILKRLKYIIYDLLLLGIFIAYVLGTITPNLVTPLLGASISVLQLILSFFMSESPYFLLSKNKNLEARSVLQNLRKRNFNEKEIGIIITTMIKEERELRKLKLFSPIENRKATVSVTITIAAQQFTGITVFIMNLHEVLYNCDILQSHIMSIIFILLIVLMEYLYRSILIRHSLKLQIISAILSTIALLTLATYSTLKNNGTNLKDFTCIPVISLIIFGVSFKYDKGYLPKDIVDSYYPDAFKNIGLIYATFVQVLGAWMSVELFQRLEIHVAIYIFVFINVASTIFIVFHSPSVRRIDMERSTYSGNDIGMFGDKNEAHGYDDVETELCLEPQVNTVDKMTVSVTSANIFEGTFPQLVAVLAGTLTAVSDGMQYGWTSPVLPILMSPDSPIKVTEYQGEWLETLLMLGSFSGLSITMYLVDKIGRKRSILLATFVTIMIWVVTAVAPRVEYIFVARAFAGSAGNMAFVATPMYIAEIAEQKIRGFLSSLIYLMMLVGILIIYAVAPYIPFYAHCVLGAALAFIQLVIFPFMPESPYYLLYQDNHEAAERSLRRLRSTGKNIDKELEDIKAAVARQKTERGKIQDLFLVPSNRRGMLIMAILNAAQHFSSISVLLMNVHVVLEAAGSIYVESRIAAIMFSVIMLLAATVASFSIDKFGRKTLLILSSIASSICLLVLAIYFSLKNSGYDTGPVSWIPIVCVMLYALCFKLGLGMVPIVLTAELFPTKMKAYGMTIADGFYVISSLLSLQVYQRLKDSFGLQYPFYVFSFSCIVAAVFTYFFIPETKGKTLEEIQMILKGEHGKPNTATKE